MQYVQQQRYNSSCGVHTVKKEFREHYHGCCRCYTVLCSWPTVVKTICIVRDTVYRYGLTVTHVCRGSSLDNACCYAFATLYNDKEYECRSKVDCAMRLPPISFAQTREHELSKLWIHVWREPSNYDLLGPSLSSSVLPSDRRRSEVDRSPVST